MRKQDELIFELLKWFANKGNTRPVRSKDIQIIGYSSSDIGYHLILMDEYGLINCERIVSRTSDRVIDVIPFFLNAKGQDWLKLIETPNLTTRPRIGFIDWTQPAALAA